VFQLLRIWDTLTEIATGRLKIPDSHLQLNHTIGPRASPGPPIELPQESVEKPDASICRRNLCHL